MSDVTAHPIDTEALRKLADAATEGPWEAFGTTIAACTGPGSCQGCSGLVSPAHEPSCYWSEVAGAGEPDAEFIAAAREAVPALLDENAALRARIKSVEDTLEESEARGPAGMTFNGTPFPAWISIATVRRALTA